MLSQIQNDLKQAMKEKRDVAVSTLRLLQGQILNKEKEKRYKASSQGENPDKAALSDEEILEVIASEVKKRQDAISEFEKGGRNDLAEKEREEVRVLSSYLPPQMGEEELRELAQEAIREAGAKEKKDMGKVMTLLMPKVKGRASGSRVSEQVRALLS